MADPFEFASDVAQILESVGDTHRAAAASSLMGSVAAQLALLIGTRDAAQVIYGLADAVATQPVLQEG